MATSVSVLNVLLHGEPVATLTRVDGDRTLFAFYDHYINDPKRPTLSLGFKDRLGELITALRPVQTRIQPFLSNLLPEGPMRGYLAEQSGVSPEREFFLLWALGEDLPGAVTVESATGEAWPPARDNASGPHTGDERQTALRFSLAGVQLKFSAVENTENKGLTIPARGIGGSWIVKLPSHQFTGAPENEFSMLTLARLIGMDVPATRLVDVDTITNLPTGAGTPKGQALAIKRFDRLPDGSKVHFEDFAQIFGVYPADKYARASAMNIATVIGAEGNHQDIAEFVRRLTFNTLIGNADMHLKNWSMIYHDTRTATLAPAYDFVSTIPYMADESAALRVSRTRRFDEFTYDELAHMAARSRLPQKIVLDAARETTALFHETWNQEKHNLPLSREVISAIEAHLRKVPIAG
ncbi:type II toxin-antitoxin system HipA family toxin [Marinihelvus fidelis]|uniref:Type II toxin-antitoxin system HipA family toxin n=1 Tax=Marinihelvus fidelis TaxID=2613842 RepID=A0A5N0TA71_9GAMM|nr:type II toxin-antitoxin system HipA family toxin [Marinihelvus fidelis]KAA9131354.1 type II toxin-antitoxin system HipA family toxin [Marinihelvus fidelis]